MQKNIVQQKPSLTGNFNELVLSNIDLTTVRKVEALFPNTKMRHAVYVGNYPILCNNVVIQDRIYGKVIVGSPILKLDDFYEDKISLIELKQFIIASKMTLAKHLFREADRLMKLHCYTNIVDLAQLDAFKNVSNKTLKKIQEKSVSTNNINDEIINAFARGLNIPKIYKRTCCPTSYWRVLCDRV